MMARYSPLTWSTLHEEYSTYHRRKGDPTNISRPTTLIAYFSASGNTARLAHSLAKATGSSLFEIKPHEPYTAADLDWNDRASRSTREMENATARPAIAGTVKNMKDYQTIFVGFPIWWYEAPRIIATFLEQYDLTGKAIVPFATSGGSGMGQTTAKLRPSCPQATVLEGRVFSPHASARELERWVESL